MVPCIEKKRKGCSLPAFSYGLAGKCWTNRSAYIIIKWMEMLSAEKREKGRPPAGKNVGRQSTTERNTCISTGIQGLDEAINYLRNGDTVIWQIENVGD